MFSLRFVLGVVAVDQEMFLSEPVHAISAMSVNTTVVLTKGRRQHYLLLAVGVG